MIQSSIHTRRMEITPQDNSYIDLNANHILVIVNRAQDDQAGMRDPKTQCQCIHARTHRHCSAQCRLTRHWIRRPRGAVKDKQADQQDCRSLAAEIQCRTDNSQVHMSPADVGV